MNIYLFWYSSEKKLNRKVNQTGEKSHLKQEKIAFLPLRIRHRVPTFDSFKLHQSTIH